MTKVEGKVNYYHQRNTKEEQTVANKVRVRYDSKDQGSSPPTLYNPPSEIIPLL